MGGEEMLKKILGRIKKKKKKLLLPLKLTNKVYYFGEDDSHVHIHESYEEFVNRVTEDATEIVKDTRNDLVDLHIMQDRAVAIFREYFFREEE